MLWALLGVELAKGGPEQHALLVLREEVRIEIKVGMVGELGGQA